MTMNLAWHFLSDRDGQPMYRDGAPAIVGKTVTYVGPLVFCKSLLMELAS